MADDQIGKRIRERLLARGYRRDDGEPNVRDFAFDYRFDKGHLYSWLAGKMTPFKHIIPLCTALDCSVEWLLTGKERVTAPKAKPRQDRGSRKLVVALFGLGALLSPSGVRALGDTLPTGDVVANNPSYRKRRLLAA